MPATTTPDSQAEASNWACPIEGCPVIHADPVAVTEHLARTTTGGHGPRRELPAWPTRTPEDPTGETLEDALHDQLTHLHERYPRLPAQPDALKDWADTAASGDSDPLAGVLSRHDAATVDLAHLVTPISQSLEELYSNTARLSQLAASLSTQTQQARADLDEIASELDRRPTPDALATVRRDAAVTAIKAHEGYDGVEAALIDYASETEDYFTPGEAAEWLLEHDRFEGDVSERFVETVLETLAMEDEWLRKGGSSDYTFRTDVY